MAKTILYIVTAPTGGKLIYYLTKEENLYGVGIKLKENGKETFSAQNSLFYRKRRALRYLRLLAKETVYPIHLAEITEDFDFHRLL